MKEKRKGTCNLLLKLREKMVASGKWLSNIIKKVDKEKTKSFFASLVRVSGYAFVGIISIIYGLSKQNIDVVNNHFYAHIPKYLYTYDVLFEVVMQILATSMFCVLFSRIYLYNKNIIKGKRLYTWSPKFGIGLISISLLVYGMLIYKGMSPNPFCAIIATLVNVGPIVFSIWVYLYKEKEKKPQNKKDDEDSQKKEEGKNPHIYAARYTLVAPALLVIGYNIFVSTGMFSFYYALATHDYGKIALYSITRLLFLTFFTMLLLKNKKVLKNYYAIFAAILFLIGIVGLFLLRQGGLREYANVLLNLFLAVMTSIFMSIFESWYLYATLYEKNSKWKYTPVIIKTAKDSIIRTANWVVSLLPAFVFLLFPFQIFNYIYLLTVGLGLTVINLVWFNVILPDFDKISKSEKINNKKMSIGRGVAGLATLIFLTLDHFWFRFEGIQGFFENVVLPMFDSFEHNSITIITIFITSFLSANLITSITHYDKIREVFGKSTRIPIVIRLTSYIFACIIIMLVYSLKFDGLGISSTRADDVRIRMNVSAFMLYLFIISDLLWGLYKFCKNEERLEKYRRRKEPRLTSKKGNNVE